MAEPRRVGLVVPSSNVTLERELPRLLPPEVSLHSARVRMRTVSPQELAAMNAQATRAVQELADAAVEVLVYGCLVAVMAQGPGAHRATEARLAADLAEAGCEAPVVSSAGALVTALQELGARRVAIVAPYLPELTRRVCDYLAAEGITVTTARSLSVADNGAVGRLDQDRLLHTAARLPRDVDAVVLSACVQMPSLAVLDRARDELGVPVLTAASATADQVRRRLGLGPSVPSAPQALALTPAGGR